MKVSLSWLKQLVDYNSSPQQLAEELSLKSIGVKSITDDFFELDLTYNRGDLLSLRGVAREVATITSSKLKFEERTDWGNFIFGEKVIPETEVLIEDSNACPLYTLTKIELPAVQPSKPDIVKKLADSGMRSINNIADVTNLIMLEYGQPMHAFDARGVKDESIMVRTAKKGERITTLDGKTRDLETSDLLIADSLNALGIAGVMGGKDSEVNDSTKTILLEAAIFDPVSIRNTSKRLGLYSEASKRFQHGLTKKRLFQALDKAIRLYQEFGGKMIGFKIVGEKEDPPKTISLNHERLNKLIGVEIPAHDIEQSLKSLDFQLASHLTGGNTFWDVTVPYFRLDIQIEEDLVEEVARMYGYEKIAGRMLEVKDPESLDQTVVNFVHDLKVSCKEAGLTEVQTYSFYSSKVINDLGLKTSDLIKIANPISSETEYMRNNLWPNLVEVVGKNLKNGFSDIAIFEVGKVYGPGENGLPFENYHLSIALMNGTDNPIQELVTILNTLSPRTPVRGLKINLEIPRYADNPPSAGRNDSRTEKEKQLFHPTRFQNLEKGGKIAGKVAEVHPRILNKFGIEKRVAVVEISISS